MTYESSEKFSRQAVEMRLETMRAELERLRTESERMRTENDTLRAAQHKDPQKFLMETKEIAENLLGMVSKGEAAAATEGEGEEEKFDWKKEAAKGAISLLAQAPAIAEKIAGGMGAAKQQQQQQQQMMLAQQQQAMMAQQGRMMPPQMMQRPGLPPLQQQGVGALPPPRRRGVAPGAWSPGNMMPVAQEIPFQPPLPPRYGVPAPRPVPAQESMPVEPAPQLQAQPAPTSVEQTQREQQEPEQSTPEMEELNAFAKGFEEFITEMEKAVNSEIIAPDVFARGLISRLGPEQTAQLIQQIPVANFIELVDQRGMSVLATRDGKQYARAVWAETSKLLGQA
jgi:hypothetical protein